MSALNYKTHVGAADQNKNLSALHGVLIVVKRGVPFCQHGSLFMLASISDHFESHLKRLATEKQTT